MKPFIKSLPIALFFWTLYIPVLAQDRISSYHIEKNDKWNVKIFNNDPLKVREYTFTNGLTLITSNNPDAPRISTMIAARTGSKNDPSDHTGLAHYLEHMLFKGTDKYGTLDWAKEQTYLKQIEDLYEEYNHNSDSLQRREIYHRIDSLSQLAAQFAIANEYDKMCQAMGATGTNAFTSNEMTVYVNDIPSNMFHKWVELESERFRNPVFRLFHTELEAVYEEKNISLDQDNSKVYEKLYSELFKNHNYGKQTTIGTIEDLKNPSLVAIRKYYNTYYVPNNMAIIISGDFDPDVAADAISEHFAYMKSAETPVYKYDYEMIHANPREFTVSGPDAESVTIGYRIEGAGSEAVKIARIIDLLLSNSQAGLIDLNLIKAQKVLSAYSYMDVMNDYSVFTMKGSPKDGQSLKEVRDLLVAEMQKIIQGEFDESLIKSVILNQEIDRIYQFRNNDTRCDFLLESFISTEGYQKHYNELWEMNKISKQQIMDFAAEFLNQDRVEIFKITGKDSSILKVAKPEIHPVELNRDKESVFIKNWISEDVKPIEPVFANFNVIKKGTFKNGSIQYVKNNNSRLFELTYVIEKGRLHDKVMPFVMKYLSMVGNDTLNAADFSRRLYDLGCRFTTSCADRKSYISLSGPDENFENALALIESLLQHPAKENEILRGIISHESKTRKDLKLNNRIAASKLSAYVLYGAENPQTWVLSASELNALSVSDIVSRIETLSKTEQTVFYYGPKELNNTIDYVGSIHRLMKPESSAPPKKFMVQEHKTQEVYFLNFDMVQASIYWETPTHIYDTSREAQKTLFNQYFGGDMSSVVFQNLRESKALAYSTFAAYVTSRFKDESDYSIAFIGTQADKFHEAIEGMNGLIRDLPMEDNIFALSKASLMNRFETQRVADYEMLNYAENVHTQGWATDPSAFVYKSLEKLNFEDVKSFHQKEFASRIFCLGIVASKDRINKSELEKYGKIHFLTPEEVYGY